MEPIDQRIDEFITAWESIFNERIERAVAIEHLARLTNMYQLVAKLQTEIPVNSESSEMKS